MTVRDNAGRILTSGNPVICNMWKKAGYEVIKSKKNAGREK
ncbi:MAG: hypothetical protein ACLU9Q_11645 [Marvinbryantia sp.]|nr:hypothetical protein [uncultured Marvinbryantia sp.]